VQLRGECRIECKGKDLAYKVPEVISWRSEVMTNAEVDWSVE